MRRTQITSPPKRHISDHGGCRGRREGNENAFVNQALGRCGASAEGAETPAPPQSIFASVNQVPDFFPRYPRVPQELGRGQVPEKQPHIGAFSQEVGFGGGSLTVSGLRPSPTCHRSGATYFRFSAPEARRKRRKSPPAVRDAPAALEDRQPLGRSIPSRLTDPPKRPSGSAKRRVAAPAQKGGRERDTGARIN